MIEVSAAGNAVTDGNDIRYTVRLSEPASTTVTMNCRGLRGTAEHDDADRGTYDSVEDQVSGVLSFAPGETSKDILVATDYDNDNEYDESLVLELSGLSANAAFERGTPTLRATGTILDDDGSEVNPALFVSDLDAIEEDTGSRQAVFDVELSRRPAQRSRSTTRRAT